MDVINYLKQEFKGEVIMAEGKVYVGSGWSFNSKFGEIFNLSIKKSDFDNLKTDKYGQVKLKLIKRKNPDPKSKATHYICEDDYQKQDNKQSYSNPVENKQQSKKETKKEEFESDFDSDMPF